MFLFPSLVGEMLAILVADTLASYLGMSGRWSELFGIAEEEACSLFQYRVSFWMRLASEEEIFLDCWRYLWLTL